MASSIAAIPHSQPNDVDNTASNLPDPLTQKNNHQELGKMIEPSSKAGETACKEDTQPHQHVQFTESREQTSRSGRPDTMAIQTAPNTPPRGRSGIRGWKESPQNLLKKAVSASRSRSRRRLLSAKERALSPTPASRRNRTSLRYGSIASSVQSSADGSPEIQAMLKWEVVPDLELVNQALEQLSCRSEGEDTCPSGTQQQLQLLATLLATARADGKKLLTEAMHARSIGHTEICRAKCVQIVHSPHVESETKVYAYNILSTMASVGQAERFLNESAKLVQQMMSEDGEKEKLLGAIAVLREGAREKEGCHRRVESRDVMRKMSKGSESAVGSVSEQPEPMMHLELPKPAFAMEDPKKVTPMTEKILEWAGECASGP